MTSTNSEAAAELADALIVQKFLRARVGDAEKTGPFSILFSPGNRSSYGNYAIPDDDARPTPAEIAALEEAFRIRKRRPRLEYAPAASPAVEAALSAAGFTVEMRPPLMTYRAGGAAPGSIPDGFDLAFVEDEAGLALAVAVEAEANAADEADFQWLKRTPGRGGRVALARDRLTGGGQAPEPTSRRSAAWRRW